MPGKMKKERPRVLPGITYHIQTPLGDAYITVNENNDGQPFEVFVNSAKAGSETAAVSEAIGRLISYILRMPSAVEPRIRIKEVYDLLQTIGGVRSSISGEDTILSLPDGIAKALEFYLDSANKLGDE